MPTARAFLFALLCAGAATIQAQVVVFTENFGTPTGSTAIGAYTGYQNIDALTFSGTGDIRNTTVSSGYAGASGGGNVFLTSGGTASLTVSGINTIGYEAGTLSLTFGAFKSTTGSNLTELTLSVSSDGVNYTAIALPAQPTGAGTSQWRSITLTSEAFPIASNVSLRWTNTAAASLQFRLDDVSMTGSLAAVPEPSTYAALSGVAVLAIAIWRRRKRLTSAPHA